MYKTKITINGSWISKYFPKGSRVSKNDPDSSWISKWIFSWYWTKKKLFVEVLFKSNFQTFVTNYKFWLSMFFDNNLLKKLQISEPWVFCNLTQKKHKYFFLKMMYQSCKKRFWMRFKILFENNTVSVWFMVFNLESNIFVQPGTKNLNQSFEMVAAYHILIE